MKKLLLSLFGVLFAVTVALAQRTVTGTITDQTGEPLIGANVLVKGTTVGAVTDFDGTYSIDVPDGGSVMVFSYTGYESQEVTLGESNTLDLIMSEGVALDEIVVTALGVERDEKALGYAVQEVDGADIARSGSSNAVDALVGKSSGVQITRSSGSVGGGSRILIRGVTSMVGNNQPLIVIDGVRVNNETILSQASTAGTAASNRLMDLNPDDIESINVLKGAAATAVYGTAGSTGVVIITTKKGQNSADRFDINFTSTLDFSSITNMIDLQDIYAQGRGETYRDPSTGESGSWGPRITDLEFATDPNHPNAPGAAAFGPEGNYLYDNNGFLVPSGTGNGIPANIYDNVEPFYQTGLSTTNSLAISGGGATASFRLSASHLAAEGVVPNEEYDRTTVKLASTLQPTAKLSFASSINYTKSDYVRVQQGSNTSGLLLGQLRTPISFDNANGFDPDDAVDEVSSYQFPDFSQRNYRGGGGYDNPYWTVNNALGFEDVSRTFGNAKVDYEFSPWLRVGVNLGFDLTSDVRKQEFEINSRTNAGGRVQHNEFATKQFDNYLTVTGSGSLTDKLSMNYLAGVNAFSFENHETQTRGDGLVFPGFIDISNATQVTAFEDIVRYRTLGFFGQVEFSYNNMLYFTASARQD